MKSFLKNIWAFGEISICIFFIKNPAFFFVVRMLFNFKPSDEEKKTIINLVKSSYKRKS